MKVFEVFLETTIPGVRGGPFEDMIFRRLPDDTWRITMPDGSTADAPNRLEARRIATDWNNVNRPEFNTRPQRGTLTADPETRSSANRGDAERAGASDDIRPGVRQGTPTTNSLSAGERRRLARTGSITRRGVTYTRRQIAAADAEAERLGRTGAGRDVNPGDERAASRNQNPDAEPGRIRKTLRWLRGLIARAGLWGNLGFALITVEEFTTHVDRYLQVLERPDVNFDQSHPDALRAYDEIKRAVATAIIASAAQGAITVGWIAMVARGASMFGGPFAFIIAFIIGAGLGYAADWFATKIAENTDFAEWLGEQIILKHVLSPESVQAYALSYQKGRQGLGLESVQEADDEEAPNVTAPPISNGEAELQSFVRDWMQNDPEFKQNVEKARETGPITIRRALATEDE